LTTHGTSYLGLIMRLGGVYETRGDSHKRLNFSELEVKQRKFEKYYSVPLSGLAVVNQATRHAGVLALWAAIRTPTAFGLRAQLFQSFSVIF
ncbi:hypothetical protein QVM55_28850, partial [Pseudomonas monteilii]|uniref:hypothetical protein n=1 Tax=Pseudomonas monteilii TaxID=76759 RepID=UPI003525AF98